MNEEEREKWKSMSDEERYKSALKIRRHLKKWSKKNPGKRIPEVLKLIMKLAERTIKKKGKYQSLTEIEMGVRGNQSGIQVIDNS